MLETFLVTVLVLAAVAAGLTLLPRLGEGGETVRERLARAPGLDGVIAVLTWAPWIFGAVYAGWPGLLAVIVAQALVLQGWVWAHEWAHPRARRGPRIVHFLNRTVGRWRNHLALWVTLIGLPTLCAIRITEVLAYPPLVWLLNFPRYKQSEWVNVSRHKFDGLVGHDLIWCLYCDWMTGVYAFGGELLRNVESFWCPIQFADPAKCRNCQHAFPDLASHWVRPDKTMAEVEALMQQQYGDGQRSWFGHPDRITVEGQAQSAPAEPDGADASCSGQVE
jgi:hypothetical protein